MIDGFPDGWVGGIPVCVLSGNAQQEDDGRATTRDGTLVKERDYISLGLAGAHDQVLTSSTPSAQEKMECDNVELSLGLGPPEKASLQEATPAEQPTGMAASHAKFADQQLRLKVASAGAKSQHFWHQNFRVSLSNDHHQHAANRQAEAAKHGASSSYGMGYTSSVPAWSPMPGRFAIPVPKVSTIPAKRPYQDASGERRSIPMGEVAPSSGMQPGIYAWNTDTFNASSSVGGGWQQVHVNFEQAVSNHVHGSVFGHSSRPLASALPPTSSFKIPHSAAAASTPPPGSASVAANGAPSSSQTADVSAHQESEHDNNCNKAPVVGWPPVRSFRKTTLQAAHRSNRMSSDDLPTKSMGGPSTIGNVLEGSNSKNGFFVKAKLDGVRICRKVDLKAYESYEGLKGALQDMFQGFVSDSAKLDLLHGNNYVVTHEDKDGDCLLVGDVPWHMFVESSVKSLRIMKAMDAIGIGEKGSAKLKAQANGQPS